jgi:hypothetical protein
MLGVNPQAALLGNGLRRNGCSEHQPLPAAAFVFSEITKWRAAWFP